MLGRGSLSSSPISGAILAPTVFTWRNQLVDLDLVTRIYREDGTFVEFVNERRGLVKTTKRRANLLELQVVDVDRSALEALVPSERFATADFAKLFVDHVGRAVPQVVGDAMKVPLTYVDDTLGAYRYIACKVLGAMPTVRTVYRKGAVISASEYSVDTTTVAGITYVRLTFPVEQREFSGALYELTADILGPGSRAASDEIQRLLQQVGATTDASSFASASLYCSLNSMVADCGYVDPRRTIDCIQDLLQIARGQLYKTPAGAYGIFIDRPRDVHLVLDDRSDELQIAEIVEPDLARTLTFEYRPSSSQAEKYTGKLSRTTTGAVGERVYKNPYLRDHVAADRLLCYLQKRENARREARATIHAVQLAPGDLVAIRSPNNYADVKVFAAPEISRPADRNQASLLEYDESIYVYTAGTLPADATNGYTPDYSQTKPAAPTGLTVVSQGTSADSDGKVTAYALIRATPPAVNWSRLMVQVTDTTTTEVYQAQLLLNAGNYEARVSGLRPNRAHQVVCWAVNATNIDGFTTAAVAFTSANATTALSAPSVAVAQLQSFQIRVDLGQVADIAGQPHFRRNIIFVKAGAGSFAEVVRTDQRFYDYPVTHGVAYDVKARSEDVNGNESSDSSTASITPAKIVDGSYIVDASINRSRSYTGTGSSSGSITGAGGGITLTFDYYTFFPSFWCDVAANPTLVQASNAGGAPGNDIGLCKLINNGATDSYAVQWRTFLA